MIYGFGKAIYSQFSQRRGVLPYHKAIPSIQFHLRCFKIDAVCNYSCASRLCQKCININCRVFRFNSAETGPLTRKNETEGEGFLNALEALKAHDGGDCPELAFTGMLNALNAGPQLGSSMFVFTDAPPKDASKYNRTSVINRALDLEIKINFFATAGCGSSKFQPFHDVAKETGGLVYPLRNTLDLQQLGKLITTSLRSPTSIGGGKGEDSSGKRKRSASQEYSILVDDSIERISISVTTEFSVTDIRLVDPTKTSVTAGRVKLTKGVVYNLETPKQGVYKLIIPARAGKHEYKVDAVSGINIDFGHYYVAISKRGTRIPVPLDQPLEGMLN